MAVNSPNMDAIRERARRVKEAKSTRDFGDNDDFRSPVAGRNYVRILPPWSSKGEIFKEVIKHKNIPTESGDERSCYCGQMLGKPCAVCDRIEILSIYVNMNPSWDKTKYPKSRFYCNATVLNEVEESGSYILVPVRQRPFIYGVAMTVYDDVCIIMSNPRIGNITDPHEGYCLEIMMPEDFQGKNNYTTKIEPPQGEIPTPDDVDKKSYINAILDSLHDLDKVFSGAVTGYNELESIADSMTRYYERSLGVKVGKSKPTNNFPGDETPRVPSKPAKVEAPVAPVAPVPAPVATPVAPVAPPIEPANLITIGGFAYEVESEANGVLTLVYDGEKSYACSICKNTVWKKQGFATKHAATAHSSGSSSPTAPAAPVASTPVASTPVAPAPVAPTAPAAPVAPAPKKARNSNVPECFGNYMVEGRCDKKSATLCPYSEYCKKEIK